MEGNGQGSMFNVQWYACVCVCVRACVRVRARVYACVCMCMCMRNIAGSIPALHGHPRLSSPLWLPTATCVCLSMCVEKKEEKRKKELSLAKTAKRSYDLAQKGTARVWLHR